ncbi:MAG: hypothetical protein AAYR33_02470 [Acetobacteraceae bacterium]
MPLLKTTSSLKLASLSLFKFDIKEIADTAFQSGLARGADDPGAILREKSGLKGEGGKSKKF